MARASRVPGSQRVQSSGEQARWRGSSLFSRDFDSGVTSSEFAGAVDPIGDPTKSSAPASPNHLTSEIISGDRNHCSGDWQCTVTLGLALPSRAYSRETDESGNGRHRKT